MYIVHLIDFRGGRSTKNNNQTNIKKVVKESKARFNDFRKETSCTFDLYSFDVILYVDYIPGSMQSEKWKNGKMVRHGPPNISRRILAPFHESLLKQGKSSIPKV